MQHFAVEVERDVVGVLAYWPLVDVSNRDDAFDDDDKYFCDYSNCSMYGKLCDTNCTRHYLVAVSAVALCDVSMSIWYSIIYHKHHNDEMQSMAVAMIIDWIIFHQNHCFH